MDNKVPCVLTKTRSCLLSEGFDAQLVFIKDLLSPYMLCELSTGRDSAQQDGDLPNLDRGQRRL